MSCYPALRILSFIVLAAVGFSVATADEDDAQPIVSVAAKQLVAGMPATEPSGDMPVMAMTAAPPPATLPAERLPQYRIGYQRADATLQSQVHDGTVRFILTNRAILEQVGRPLLLEATILIDGQPFSQVRDQLAATLLTASTQPAELTQETSQPDQPPVSDAEAAPVETEAVDAEAADADAETVDAEAADAEAADAEVATDAEEPESEPVSPATEPVYRLASDPEDVMRRYAEALGESSDAAEAGWLMTHWTDGPTLLVLHPYYQSFRADQRPVFTLLDTNRDGTLSKMELDAADKSFERCDANRDDIVDVLEIAKAADGLRDPSHGADASGPLFWLLSDLVGVSEQDSHLYQCIAVFDTDQNGRIEAAEIDKLTEQTPDVALTVAFVSDAAETSQLHVTGVNQESSITLQSDRQGHGVDVSIGSLTIHLAALQAAVQQRHSGQIAIGAVVDGYPLLPELDPHDDGRFTIRERRTLTERLRAKDRNDDQTLSDQECLSPIRVCIGFGPIVHQELATVRAVPPTAVTESISGPDWFVRMDRNQDKDLTRGEFPGTDEQFAALDADGDLLIDAGEAKKSETQSDK